MWAKRAIVPSSVTTQYGRRGTTVEHKGHTIAFNNHKLLQLYEKEVYGNDAGRQKRRFLTVWSWEEIGSH